MADRGRPRGFDRAQALRRAMEVFWSRGYEGASLAELTQAMGINSPSLYAAFGCKEALFREAIEQYLATDGSGTMRALNEGATARASIEAMLRAAVDSIARLDNPSGCMVVLGAVGCAPQNEPVQNFLQARRTETQDRIRARLHQAIAAGELSKEIDVDAIAGFYCTVLHGMSIQSRDGASNAQLQTVVDCAMAAWDRLIEPKKPSPVRGVRA